MNAALIAVIAKYLGRQLATRVAVDASGIDKEISGHIFRKTMLQASHKSIVTKRHKKHKEETEEKLNYKTLKTVFVFFGLLLAIDRNR